MSRAVPGIDLLAMAFAVEPDSPWFGLSEPEDRTRRLTMDSGPAICRPP